MITIKAQDHIAFSLTTGQLEVGHAYEDDQGDLVFPIESADDINKIQYVVITRGENAVPRVYFHQYDLSTPGSWRFREIDVTLTTRPRGSDGQ